MSECTDEQHYFAIVPRGENGECVFVAENGELYLYQHCVYCGLFIEEPVARSVVPHVFNAINTADVDDAEH